MAFHLIQEGWDGYESVESDIGRMMVFHGYEIDRSKISDYLTQDIKSAIELYCRFKLFGFPYSGGWAEQPARIVDVIETLDIEAKKMQKAKHGKR